MSFSITNAAAQRILNILDKNPKKIGLRISVEGGGCSGFSYKYKLEEQKQANDSIYCNGKATVFIDSISLPFLIKAELDFVDDIMGQYFQINNPNSTSSCGCGISFSI